MQNFGQIGPPSIILKSDSLYKESTQQSSKVFWIQKAWLDASSHETFRSVIEHPNSTNRLMHNRNGRDLFPFVPKHESFCLMQMGSDEPLAKTSGIHKLNNKQWWLGSACNWSSLSIGMACIMWGAGARAWPLSTLFLMRAPSLSFKVMSTLQVEFLIFSFLWREYCRSEDDLSNSFFIKPGI